MTGAPKRIWVQWPNVNGCGLAFNTPANPRHKSDDRFNKRTAYILATPEALAASPEVQALIAAAILDAQLRAFERGRVDTPDEIRAEAAAALTEAQAEIERLRDEVEKSQLLLGRWWAAGTHAEVQLRNLGSDGYGSGLLELLRSAAITGKPG